MGIRLTLAASSSSGMAIWRSILRCAGARGAPNPGVEYAHDAPFSLARNRKTCSILLCSIPTLCHTDPVAGKRSMLHTESTFFALHTKVTEVLALASVILCSWYAFWAMPRLRLEKDCLIWLAPCASHQATQQAGMYMLAGVHRPSQSANWVHVYVENTELEAPPSSMWIHANLWTAHLETWLTHER